MTSAYKKLLSKARFRVSEVADRHILLEAESDRGRLLFCPAFRRLQQKAQVFSMESNAAVRSRLTHSFEVSQIGRYLSDQISLKLIEKNLASREECAALTTFVETACLMHDIGNPPFGHFGESAISEWFRINGKATIRESIKSKKAIPDKKIEEALADFLEFDGNPQGLRIVTRLQRNSDENGLNLTKTTLAAYLKYVRSSGEKSNEIKSPFTKKCGYFSTERDLVNSIWSEFGYKKPQRFPLAYIMEAADDIAYCISDLEDSIEKGLLHKTQALKEIHEEWKKTSPPNDKTTKEINKILKNAITEKRQDDSPYTFTDFRTSLNRVLVNYAADQYISAHDQILNGLKSSLIASESACGKILETLKNYCRKKVYRHESVHKIELAGYKAIFGLLDQYSCLLKSSENRFTCALARDRKDAEERPIIIESKLLSLFPKNYIAAYKDQLNRIHSKGIERSIAEWILRAHLVTDFISGMTDDFATTTYQTLSGMKL